MNGKEVNSMNDKQSSDRNDDQENEIFSGEVNSKSSPGEFSSNVYVQLLEYNNNGHDADSQSSTDFITSVDIPDCERNTEFDELSFDGGHFVIRSSAKVALSSPLLSSPVNDGKKSSVPHLIVNSSVINSSTVVKSSVISPTIIIDPVADRRKEMNETNQQVLVGSNVREILAKESKVIPISLLQVQRSTKAIVLAQDQQVTTGMVEVKQDRQAMETSVRDQQDRTTIEVPLFLKEQPFILKDSIAGAGGTLLPATSYILVQNIPSLIEDSTLALKSEPCSESVMELQATSSSIILSTGLIRPPSVGGIQAPAKSPSSVSTCSGSTTPAAGGGKRKKIAKQSVAEKVAETMGVMEKEKDKQCGVCGDTALGCNFDAISCESCKAFFRRNAFKESQLNCLFEGNCSIDINTRRFCPYCRLKKCFAIGMKRELILGDDDRKKRMEKVLENRVKRQKKDPAAGSSSAVQASGSQDESSVNSPIVSATGFAFAEQFSLSSQISHISQLVDEQQLAAMEQQMTQSAMMTSAGSQLSTGCTNLLSLLRHSQPVNDSQEETATNEAKNDSVESSPIRRLTQEELVMVQELDQVYDLSFTVDLEPLVHVKQLDPSVNQLVNQTSITVLRLIKFAKRLEDFVHLPQACQIGILKGSWIHIVLLRSVSLYDCDRDVWVTPRGDIPTEILKNATGYVQLHDDHVRYCKSIRSLIHDDLTIVVILLVIVLFAPEGPHVLMRELVSNIQDKYLVLLKHYLESKYTFALAAELFPQLMSKLKELTELAEVHSRYLLDVNPREIEPIMLEILDLK